MDIKYSGKIYGLCTSELDDFRQMIQSTKIKLDQISYQSLNKFCLSPRGMVELAQYARKQWFSCLSNYIFTLMP